MKKLALHNRGYLLCNVHTVDLRKFAISIQQRHFMAKVSERTLKYL